MLFHLCFVNDLQIRSAPTNAQFYYYVFHSLLAPTCFGFNAIIRELTPMLLKLTAIKYSCNAYAYQTYRLQF